MRKAQTMVTKAIVFEKPTTSRFISERPDAVACLDRMAILFFMENSPNLDWSHPSI
jgi:hypothetical protein